MRPIDRIPQNSFAGGELSEAIYGRAELAKFNIGLRECYNCFIEVEGGVSNRGGWRMCTSTKDGQEVRLLPFEATGTNTFVIEAGAEYFRFIYRGGYVLDIMLDPYEVVHTYTLEQLKEMNYSQSNDIMTLVHGDHVPRELTRIDNDDWDLSDIDFASELAAPANLVVTTETGAGGGERENSWVVTAVNAAGRESEASAPVVHYNNFNNNSDEVTLGWDAVTGATEYYIYGLSAGRYGLHGKSDTLAYVSTLPASNSNTALTPKIPANPFNGANNYPQVVFLYQQRRGFASTYSKPTTFWMSNVGFYDDFRKSSPSVPSDAVEFTINGKRGQEIYALLDIEDLLMFTEGNEWRIASPDTGFSASQPPLARPQSAYGSAKIQPQLVGSDVFYMQASGRDLLAISYSNDFNRYMSRSLSIMARHLTAQSGFALENWTYAHQPNSQLLVTRTDDIYLNMTYNQEHSIQAWGRSFTPNGRVESVATIREDDGIDITYASIRREVAGSVTRFIERLDPRIWTDVRHGFFVDCGLTNDSPVDITAVTNANPGAVTSNNHGLSDGDLVYIDPPYGMPELTGRYQVKSATTHTFSLGHYETGDDVNTTTFGSYISGGVWREMFTTFSGLDHLEGENVVGLADGLVVGMGVGGSNMVVTSGSVTLPFPAATVHIGLRYDSYIRTLQLDDTGGKKQTLKTQAAYVHARVKNTRGIWTGTNANNLVEAKPRATESMFDPPRLVTGLIRESLPAGWQSDLSIMIAQPYPLPMTITSLTPETALGG